MIEFMKTETQKCGDDEIAARDSRYEQISKVNPKRELYQAVQNGLYKKGYKFAKVIEYRQGDTTENTSENATEDKTGDNRTE